MFLEATVYFYWYIQHIGIFKQLQRNKPSSQTNLILLQNKRSDMQPMLKLGTNLNFTIWFKRV